MKLGMLLKSWVEVHGLDLSMETKKVLSHDLKTD